VFFAPISRFRAVAESESLSSGDRRQASRQQKAATAEHGDIAEAIAHQPTFNTQLEGDNTAGVDAIRIWATVPLANHESHIASRPLRTKHQNTRGAVAGCRLHSLLHIRHHHAPTQKDNAD
jgi:hypothetical protein